MKRTLVLRYAVPMEAVVSSLIHERFATAASSLQVRKGHWNWQALEATAKAELRNMYVLLLRTLQRDFLKKTFFAPSIKSILANLS